MVEFEGIGPCSLTGMMLADQKPTAPLTLVGDASGGTMMLLWGGVAKA
ncbi:hypothetical protein ABXT70_05350 [Candidatus Njordibacter sp. Uisw_039]